MPVDLILTRAAEPAPDPGLPPGFNLLAVTGANDQGFPFVNAFYTSHNFPDRWANDMLARGGRAVVILRDAVPVAAAWLVRGPVRVDEIRRTFDPGPDADYYLGDFVSPAHRGQGLQRALIRARLAMSHAAGRRWAIAMTRDTVPASLANYTSERFQRAAEFRVRRIFGIEFDRIRKTSTLPCGFIQRV